jgi:hypothetical protein
LINLISSKGNDDQQNAEYQCNPCLDKCYFSY